ncbi:MAG: c-type cytochrome biogenesis protein CcmI/CycH, partial [Actinomycetota bacterium]
GAGPPLAVKRVTDPVFPVPFRLGPEDVMLRGTSLEGEVRLIARLKRDGSPGPAVPGDLEGVAKAPVRVGQSEVQIVLDHVR